MTAKNRKMAARASALVGTVALLLASAAQAQGVQFDIPAGDLRAALDSYIRLTGQQIVFRSDDLKGKRSRGVQGSMSTDKALDALLTDTGLELRRDASGAAAKQGEQVSIEKSVYVSLCRKHWEDETGRREQ